jgi:hypothetical protein
VLKQGLDTLVVGADYISDPVLQPGLDKLVVGADYIKLIWVPDTFFVNEKVASFHQATQVHYFHLFTPSNIKGTV